MTADGANTVVGRGRAMCNADMPCLPYLQSPDAGIHPSHATDPSSLPLTEPEAFRSPDLPRKLLHLL
jgi:hypothetical protein